MKLSFAEFDTIYRASLDEIWLHWNETMQAEIARHCIAWSPGRMDFRAYLVASSVRFYKAYCALVDSGCSSMCDVGGFWGVWPITAKKLGYDVAMTEAMKYYGDSFDPLFDVIRANGVEIVDYDPFLPKAFIDKRFGFVTVMAVLEHYPHSLKIFIENVKRVATDDGRLYLEVPNIAYLPKRLDLIQGRTPLAQLADIYQSEEPFIGHHHEFTIWEMREFARLGGLKIIAEEIFNYSMTGANLKSLKSFILYPAVSLAFQLSKTGRECIAVVCEVEK